jgi:hypothetical protein
MYPNTRREIADLTVAKFSFHSSSRRNGEWFDPLSVTLERVVPQVKKEMHYPNVRFWAEYHPIIG